MDDFNLSELLEIESALRNRAMQMNNQKIDGMICPITPNSAVEAFGRSERISTELAEKFKAEIAKRRKTGG